MTTDDFVSLKVLHQKDLASLHTKMCDAPVLRNERLSNEGQEVSSCPSCGRMVISSMCSVTVSRV